MRHSIDLTTIKMNDYFYYFPLCRCPCPNFPARCPSSRSSPSPRRPTRPRRDPLRPARTAPSASKWTTTPSRKVSTLRWLLTELLSGPMRNICIRNTEIIFEIQLEIMTPTGSESNNVDPTEHILIITQCRSKQSSAAPDLIDFK